jgi:hypothetical protein
MMRALRAFERRFTARPSGRSHGTRWSLLGLALLQLVWIVLMAAPSAQPVSADDGCDWGLCIIQPPPPPRPPVPPPGGGEGVAAAQAAWAMPEAVMALAMAVVNHAAR